MSIAVFQLAGTWKIWRWAHGGKLLTKIEGSFKTKQLRAIVQLLWFNSISTFVTFKRYLICSHTSDYGSYIPGHFGSSCTADELLLILSLACFESGVCNNEPTNHLSGSECSSCAWCL